MGYLTSVDGTPILATISLTTWVTIEAVMSGVKREPARSWIRVRDRGRINVDGGFTQH
jgi:hypothetical protein